jgi:pilus assembly protein FimV
VRKPVKEGAEMGDIDDEKTQSPFDSESEDETITLSMDELDGILSEAEIVSDTQKKGQAVGEDLSEPVGGGREFGESELDESGFDDLELDDSDLGGPGLDESGIDELGLDEPGLEDLDLDEPGLNDLDIGGMEDIDLERGNDIESSSEDEFDISGEIDELSPKDLEDIELEVGDVDTIVQDLEEELEQEGEIFIPGPVTEELPIEETDMEPVESEEVSLGLDEGEEIGELDLDELDLGEGGLEKDLEDIDLTEAPVLGEKDEKLEGFELEDQEAFREAGIEGIEEEIKDLELPDLEDEEIEMPEGDFQLSQPDEKQIPEETPEEVVLTSEEEDILSKDIDLEDEEVVTVTGEELSKMEEELGIDSALLDEVTSILKYMDTLLGDLPEEKIKEFAASSYFERYKSLFEKLGIK